MKQMLLNDYRFPTDEWKLKFYNGNKFLYK